ncbi:MAG TPA: serine/threonine-protein kinase [Thermoanaerobaculia bacterium]|nr:serine/threonine-protein kinase [Thermoanaerobaculia bacterium]
MTRCARCDAELPPSGRFCPVCGHAASESLSRLPTEMGSAAKPVPPRPPSSVGRLASSGSLDLGAFPPGAMLGERYRVVGLLGKGGMGEVYRADDLKLGQAVALKFLPKAVSNDESLLARFHAEVRLARQVSHPNVCRIYDIGEIEGRHFLSMEYVDGEDLASLLKRIGHLPVDKTVDIGRQLCAGLHAAHEKGVLHRDLKPANVMLDGRGRVRITDFGLAVAAEEAASQGEVSGTPAYMAPEQLAGKPASVRSDLYALGLVLYEVATGKRAFDAPTLAEMRRKHEQETPTAPSNVLAGFDPAVERVILRCLEKDPRARPSSAVQVAGALPGGDPLAAALAAGETPSPEMVAAAGPEGVISTARAAALLSGVVVLVGLGVALTRWSTDLGLSPLPKPPDALEERSREVARRLGWTDPPVDSARGFARDYAYLSHLARTGKPGWARGLAAGWWKPAEFAYRQSPRPLLPASANGDVSRSDPPLEVTGMFTVVLDPEGHLRSFVAVPPQAVSKPPSASVPDWSALLSEAGLDPKSFVASEPVWLPRVPFDSIAGFTGPMPGGGGETLNVVAAAFRGRPVSFEIVAPWSKPSRDAPRPQGLRERVGRSSIIFGGLFVAAAAAWFARRNARLGRGDRRGAARIAAAVFVAAFASFLLGVHPALIGHFASLVPILFLPAGLTGLAWVFYLAFEPYFRRRYPDLLVSWTRLVGGRFGDPLVGRDLLGGLLLGCVSLLLLFAVNLAPAFLASGGQTPVFFTGETLAGIRGVAAGAAGRLVGSLMQTLLLAAILFIGTLLFRQRVLAVGLLWTFAFAVGAGRENPLLEVPAGALTAALLVFALLRFGLVGLGACFVAQNMLTGVPLTLDFSLWYAGYGLFFVLIVVALAAWGFWSARGGGPLFGSAGLDD